MPVRPLRSFDAALQADCASATDAYFGGGDYRLIEMLANCEIAWWVDVGSSLQ